MHRERSARSIGLSLLSAACACFFAAGATADSTLFGCYAGAPRSHGHIDSRALASKLEHGHMNFYTYLIHDQGSDWDDLPSFLEATKNMNVKIIVDLLPPSEKCSKPFACKWSDWSANIANLASRYPHLIGYSIDDFSLNYQSVVMRGSGQPGANQEIKDMVAAGRAMNPNILFLPTVYGSGLKSFIRDYKNVADGLILYTEEYQNAGAMPTDGDWKDKISDAKQAFHWVIAGVYAIGRGTPPPAGVPAAKSDLAYQYGATGIVIYLLPDKGPTWNAITSRFARWNSTAVSVPAAGKYK